MYKLFRLYFAGLILLLLTACKKEASYFSDRLAAIQVINGVINVPIMVKMNEKLNTSGISASTLSKVNFGSAAFFFSEGKYTPFDIMNGNDTNLLKSNSFDFKKQGIYSLLVAGQVPNVETVLIEESNYTIIKLSQVPVDADSVINVRFVNLAPDVSSLDVRIQGAVSNEVSGLPYKGYTEFKAYTAKIVKGSYKFEFVVNGIVKVTQTLTISTTNRFRNVALVFRGLSAGNPALAVSSVNYFQ
jgi:hypothetical protein